MPYPYPPQTPCQDPVNGETPPTSPLHSPKSSLLFPKVDYAEAFTRIYHDSPQSSSPPSSLCPSSPPSICHILPDTVKDSNEVLAASVTSSGHHDFGHADVSPPMRKHEGRHHISQSGYHPYVRKNPPTPQAVRKIAGMMGRLATSTNSDHDDDETARKIFSQGLQQMSTERHLSMTLAWEAEKLSRLKYFIDGEQQEQEEQTIRAFEEAALFTRMVADRDTERASQDQEFIAVIQQDEVKRVKRLNAELDELGIFLPLDPSASDLDNAISKPRVLCTTLDSAGQSHRAHREGSLCAALYRVVQCNV
ncbi:hypothetical protein DFJ58DRAFT_723495 [Suillus subalutaceus]|uniref:uncharacterized protein n=1 Tax=Suillus subalutaceus TaxID=48586 RepID=UPI001B862897|nr:uncharacterized protein DFJ58DRAFT_723495 [Suillus subalutaceus]KAG1868245.1 hypothetical protein DFJ58DRAFT_723495 [Suillus subalutaceus]